MSQRGVPGASGGAAVPGLCGCAAFARLPAAGQAHSSNAAPPARLLCRGARIRAVLLPGEPQLRGWGGSRFLFRAAVSSLSALLSGGPAWRVRSSLSSCQRLASRFCSCLRRAWDEESRAERCHLPRCSLNTRLAVRGGRRGRPARSLRDAGKQGRAARTASCCWVLLDHWGRVGIAGAGRGLRWSLRNGWRLVGLCRYVLARGELPRCWHWAAPPEPQQRCPRSSLLGFCRAFNWAGAGTASSSWVRTEALPQRGPLFIPFRLLSHLLLPPRLSPPRRNLRSLRGLPLSFPSPPATHRWED